MYDIWKALTADVTLMNKMLTSRDILNTDFLYRLLKISSDLPSLYCALQDQLTNLAAQNSNQNLIETYCKVRCYYYFCLLILHKCP